MNNCIVCGSDEDIDYVFFHKSEKENSGENHYLCRDCMETTLVVCTCKKNLNEEPKEVMYVCPCDSQKNVYTSMYVDISSENKENIEHFKSFLTHFNKEYYGIAGCRGCRYTKQQIEKNINIALKSAIDFCMYSKKEDLLEYKGDSIEQDFINACEKFGINLGTPVDI